MFLGIPAMMVFAYGFWYIGETDYQRKGWLLVGLSLAASFFALFGIKWGTFGIVVCQVLLFVGLTVFRILTEKGPEAVKNPVARIDDPEANDSPRDL